MPPYIAVVGGGEPGPRDERVAEEVGRLIGESGGILICGGRGGVMAAAARGARSAGGLTVGILPGTDRSDANDSLDIALATGMGEMRNMLVVRAADVVVAVGGEYGTLSEIAFALRLDIPVVGLGTWELAKDGRARDPVVRAATPAEAVRTALELAGG